MNNQGDVGYTFHAIPRHFGAAEDVLGGKAEMHQHEEWGKHRPLPHQDLGDPGPIVSFGAMPQPTELV